MRPKERGQLLFWLAAALLLPAVVLGLSKSDRPVWEGARGLFAAGGAVLMVYGAAVWREDVTWIGVGADRPRRAGLVLLAVGAGALGAGLAHLSGDALWRLLCLPAIVGVGLYSLREAWRGRRHSLFTRGGFLMVGLLWPVPVLWALGLESFE